MATHKRTKGAKPPKINIQSYELQVLANILDTRRETVYQRASIKQWKITCDPKRKGTFQDSAAKLFNSLPENIRNCSIYSRFLALSKEYLKNKIIT